MTTNLSAVIANVKQLRTGGSFRNLLLFFRTSWGCWRPKFSNFLTVFTIGLSLARFGGAFGISGGEGWEPPPRPRYTTASQQFEELRHNITTQKT